MRFPDFNDDWRETTLGDTLDYEQPTLYIVNNTDYLNDSSLIPVLTANKSFVLGYVNEENIYDKGECIILDDFTLDIKFVDFPFKVKSSAIKILTAKKGVNIKTIYNYLLFKNLRGQEKDHKRHYISEVQPLSISLPSPAEQKRIADFLSLIDERINNLSETLRELKNQKAALLNQLFSQKLHFPDFNDEWTQTTLGEIAERVTRKNNGHVTSRPLTISAQYGLIDQRDFFNKIVASTSLEGYYLLNKGEFAYNRSSSADYPWGAIKRLESYENGALSTLYICFSLLQGYPSFIAHFFETSQWHEYIQSIAAEGARNHGLLNISVSDFFALPISLPTLEEQKKIADFLSLIDERIEVEEQLLQQYEKQKRYLLRQMFV